MWDVTARTLRQDTATAPPPTVLPATAELRPTMPPEPAPTETAQAGGGDGQLVFTDELGMRVVGQYGGAPQAVAIAGETAFVGFGPRLLALDARDPADLKLLGKSEPLPGVVQSVAVAGGVAYVAAGQAGLLTLDVNDPAHMTLLNSGAGSGVAQPAKAEAVFLAGGCVYLLESERGDGHTTLHCLDAADPAAPTLVESTQLGAYAKVTAGDELLLVFVEGQAQLRDAANANNILSTIPLGENNYTARGLVAGDTLALAESGEVNGISRYDVSDPANPVLLEQLEGLDFFFLDDVEGDENAVFTSGTFGEFGYLLDPDRAGADRSRRYDGGIRL